MTKRKKTQVLKRLQSFFVSPVANSLENSELKHWMTCESSKLNLSELNSAIVFLNKLIDANTSVPSDELVVQQRGRLIDLLTLILTKGNVQPDWVGILLSNNLREAGAAYNRIATAAAKEMDDVKAAEYWAQGATCLGELLATYPVQPDWVSNLHANHLREAGVACNRIATAAAKEMYDVKAAEYWAQGATCFGELLATYPVQPEWVSILHGNHLREAGLVCNRIATAAAKEMDDVKAAEYWAQGSTCFGELLETYPVQPDWVSVLHGNHLREAGVTCNRIATAAVKEMDDVKAAEYWVQGATCFGDLLATYPVQPDWVSVLHGNHLREAGVVCNRIATAAAKEMDDVKAAEYWAQGATCFGELLATYPVQPDWVSVLHSNHLREAGVVGNQ